MAMTDADKLFFAGGAHARAAHALLTASQTNVHMTVPFFLLVGFSLETVLKAAYLHLGGNMKVAKREIGHDLPRALACANNQGFQSANGQLEWLTETLADVHRDHSFRYLTGNSELKVADEASSLVILDDLIVQVGQLLHPEEDPESWRERLKEFET